MEIGSARIVVFIRALFAGMAVLAGLAPAAAEPVGDPARGATV